MYDEYLSHGNINCDSDEECEYNTSMCIKKKTSWFNLFFFIYARAVYHGIYVGMNLLENNKLLGWSDDLNLSLG